MATNREVFNQIASSWYGYRHHTRFKKELTDLSHRWKSGRLLNVGCGHGPDFVPFKDKFELYGIDYSINMIKLAKKYAQKYNFDVELILADARYLPYKNNEFDWAIAVASYHHIEGEAGRIMAFKELHRVMKSGSEVFITVWNRWQPRFWFKNRQAYIPWRSGDQIFQRYYYLFSARELERTLKLTGFEILRTAPESSYKFPKNVFAKNICILAKVV